VHPTETTARNTFKIQTIFYRTTNKEQTPPLVSPISVQSLQHTDKRCIYLSDL